MDTLANIILWMLLFVIVNSLKHVNIGALMNSNELGNIFKKSVCYN